MSHVVIQGPTRAGKENRFFPYASIGLDPQDMKYHGEETALEIGDGNTFREFVTVHRGTAEGGVTRIGNHNLLMAYVHVAHDCRLGDHIIMANGASLAGHIEIGDHATVGPFCGIHQFTRIGAYSFLGAYTVVNKDILPYSKTTAPRPMIVLGANKLGLERRGLSPEDIAELEKAFRLLCRQAQHHPSAGRDEGAEFEFPPRSCPDGFHSEFRARRGEVEARRFQRIHDPISKSPLCCDCRKRPFSLSGP